MCTISAPNLELQHLQVLILKVINFNNLTLFQSTNLAQHLYIMDLEGIKLFPSSFKKYKKYFTILKLKIFPPHFISSIIALTEKLSGTSNLT